jgi:lipoprotein
MSTTKTDATRTLIVTALSLVLLTSCSNSQEATSNFSDNADSGPTSISSDTQTPGETSSLTPAHGLTLTLPTNLTSDEQPKKGSNGKSRINYYVQDEAAPALIDVEYYTDNSQTASSVADRDKDAYAKDGITVTPTSTTVDGSPNAYTYTWEQNATPPWDKTAAAIDLSCQSKIADGIDGYTYGVYVCSPKDNQQSIDSMQSVLDSMTVSES